MTYAYTYAYRTDSARLVKWVTENNRPPNIIHDRELRNLLTAGRPTIHLPSRDTISRDIKAAFEKCQDRVAKLLQVSLILPLFIDFVINCILLGTPRPSPLRHRRLDVSKSPRFRCMDRSP